MPIQCDCCSFPPKCDVCWQAHCVLGADRAQAAWNYRLAAAEAAAKALPPPPKASSLQPLLPPPPSSRAPFSKIARPTGPYDKFAHEDAADRMQRKILYEEILKKHCPGYKAPPSELMCAAGQEAAMRWAWANQGKSPPNDLVQNWMTPGHSDSGLPFKAAPLPKAVPPTASLLPAPPRSSSAPEPKAAPPPLCLAVPRSSSSSTSAKSSSSAPVPAPPPFPRRLTESAALPPPQEAPVEYVRAPSIWPHCSPEAVISEAEQLSDLAAVIAAEAENHLFEAQTEAEFQQTLHDCELAHEQRDAREAELDLLRESRAASPAHLEDSQETTQFAASPQHFNLTHQDLDLAEEMLESPMGAKCKKRKTGVSPAQGISDAESDCMGEDSGSEELLGDSLEHSLDRMFPDACELQAFMACFTPENCRWSAVPTRNVSIEGIPVHLPILSPNLQWRRAENVVQFFVAESKLSPLPADWRDFQTRGEEMWSFQEQNVFTLLQEMFEYEGEILLHNPHCVEMATPAGYRWNKIPPLRLNFMKRVNSVGVLDSLGQPATHRLELSQSLRQPGWT